MMANLKSAKKRVLVNEKKRAQNQFFKANMRTTIKRVKALIGDGALDEAQEAYRRAVQAIDKAVQKGAIHKNNGNRQKSRLAKKLNKAS